MGKKRLPCLPNRWQRWLTNPLRLLLPPLPLLLIRLLSARSVGRQLPHCPAQSPAGQTSSRAVNASHFSCNRTQSC